MQTSHPIHTYLRDYIKTPTMATQVNPQSFKDRTFFPAFIDCPVQCIVNDRYLVGSDRARAYRRHWCLLGEIVDVGQCTCLHAMAKDRDGYHFMIGFHPNDPDDIPRLL
ncbi:hypothetical protein F5Y11DRAFT_321083 [Daldinia sp. FL1419]|nr:hypothetical protein F5Y11DRAFT_321083 [Daldinia sp. FL1419]